MKIGMAVAAAVFAAVCGCMSTSTGGLEIALGESDANAQVRVDDAFFGGRLDVEQAILRRAESGFAEGNARVRNLRRGDFAIQYKFYWFDGSGMEVQPGTRPWEQTVVHGGESVTFAATAPEKSAVRFVLRLRRVR